MESRLWKINRFENDMAYAASAEVRKRVSAILDKAAALRARANQARKDGLVHMARTLMQDSFSLTEDGLHLQDKL